MKKATLAIAALAMSMSTARANLDVVTMIGYKGACTADSKIAASRGSSHSAKPFACKTAMLVELGNGRRMISFVSGDGMPLVFGGPGYESSEGRVSSPIDHIYPRRDPKLVQVVPTIGGGTCFFGEGVKNPKALSCVVKMKKDGITLVYKVDMSVASTNTTKIK